MTRSELTKVASRSYLRSVRSVGLKVLKNKLSEYVRLAAAGERVVISDRDRVVAELVPPADTRSRELPDALLAAAVREGLISPAVAAPGPPREAPPVATLDELLGELAADRAER